MVGGKSKDMAGKQIMAGWTPPKFHVKVVRENEDFASSGTRWNLVGPCKCRLRRLCATGFIVGLPCIGQTEQRRAFFAGPHHDRHRRPTLQHRRLYRFNFSDR